MRYRPRDPHRAVVRPSDQGEVVVRASAFRRIGIVLAVAAVAAIAVVPSEASGRSACPATFSVLHNDRIGKLQLPQGPYRTAVSGMSCQTASDLFAAFLQDYD